MKAACLENIRTRIIIIIWVNILILIKIGNGVPGECVDFFFGQSNVEGVEDAHNVGPLEGPLMMFVKRLRQTCVCVCMCMHVCVCGCGWVGG